MPWLWIVAGPNGSGKSTLVKSGWLQSLFDEPCEILNPDDIAATLAVGTSGGDRDSINLEAVKLSDAKLDSLIADNRSVIVETVLSSPKHRSRVDAAKARGYGFGLVYVTVSSVELSVIRVEQRVANGGHDVPEARIRDRWERSHANLGWFAARADRVLVFDNGLETTLVYSRTDGEGGWLVNGRLPAVEAVLRD